MGGLVSIDLSQFLSEPLFEALSQGAAAAAALLRAALEDAVRGVPRPQRDAGERLRAGDLPRRVRGGHPAAADRGGRQQDRQAAETGRW